MSAFDASTNTASITFTNAWGTAICKESNTGQRALGFYRNDNKRYFEFLVEEDGEDNSKLWMGIWDRATSGGSGLALGGDSQRVNIATGGAALSPGTTVSVAGATPGSGAIFGIAVNFSGNGATLGGGATVPTTSDGHGNLLLPVIVDFFKNNTFLYSHLTWNWPGGGAPTRIYPLLFRTSNSASDATVSLRVVTTSFAYTLPTGYIAWGDGPAGVGLPSNDATVNWDSAKKSTGFSLSGSDLYAVLVSPNSSDFTNKEYVWSTALPTTGKRYIEFTAQQSDSLTFSNYGNTEWEFGLVDSSAADLSITYTYTNAGIVLMHQVTNVWRRGANVVASITNNMNSMNPNQNSPNIGMMVDFDNHRAWYFHPDATSGSSIFPWVGTKNAGGNPFPYSLGAVSSVDGITISESGVMRLQAYVGRNYTHAPTPIFFKMNAEGPFETHPLLPGAKSMNGSREVLPHAGDWWDTTNNPSSMTYGAADLVVWPRAVPAVAQGRNTAFSGKLYFELFKYSDNASGATIDWCFGVRLASATTMTAVAGAGATKFLDQALMFYNAASTVSGNKCVRYGVTLSWSGSESSSGAATSGGNQCPWHGIAVDFDNGKIWGGTWDKRQHRMHWGSASDPATGTGAHMTFTASTTMRIVSMHLQTAPVTEYVVMVENQNNLIGLPSGFTPWGGAIAVSATATPSGLAVSGIQNIWPFGITN